MPPFFIGGCTGAAVTCSARPVRLHRFADRPRRPRTGATTAASVDVDVTPVPRRRVVSGQVSLERVRVGLDLFASRAGQAVRMLPDALFHCDGQPQHRERRSVSGFLRFGRRGLSGLVLRAPVVTLSDDPVLVAHLRATDIFELSLRGVSPVLLGPACLLRVGSEPTLGVEGAFPGFTQRLVLLIGSGVVGLVAASRADRFGGLGAAVVVGHHHCAAVHGLVPGEQRVNSARYGQVEVARFHGGFSGVGSSSPAWHRALDGHLDTPAGVLVR